MKTKTQRKFKKSEEGMALIESIPVLFMMVLVFNFSLGFFFAVHSGILNSIGSYNYTLETFRFKSNLMYFRPGGGTTNYSKSLNRVHGITQDGSTSQSGKEDKGKWPATIRPITFNYDAADSKANLGGPQESDHTFSRNPASTNIWKVDSKYVPTGSDSIQTPRIWIKTVYGICINAECER